MVCNKLFMQQTQTLLLNLCERVAIYSCRNPLNLLHFFLAVVNIGGTVYLTGQGGPVIILLLKLPKFSY